MKTAAVGFYGFSLLVLIDIAAVLLFNPSRHDPVFLAETFVILGGILIWSALTAGRLWCGSGLTSALAMLGTLTTLVATGAAITLAVPEMFSRVEPHPVLAVLDGQAEARRPLRRTS